MTIQKSIYILLVFLLTGVSSLTVAQNTFEGQLKYRFFEQNAESGSGEMEAKTDIGLFLTPQKIVIDELDEVRGYSPIPSLESSRIYIDLTEQSFVFLSSERQGIKIRKQELIAMVSFIKQMNESA